MSQLEEKLEQVLQDPEQMNRIAALAQKLMGQPEGERPQEPQGEAIDGDMLRRIGSLMGAGSSSSRSQEMLRAIEPYLSTKRRQKLDKALRLAKLAKLAQIAMEQMGGDEG